MGRDQERREQAPWEKGAEPPDGTPPVPPSPPRGSQLPVPPLSPRPLLPVVRTGRGQEEEGMDISPSSSRSLPITSSFPKMVSTAPPAPTPRPCFPLQAWRPLPFRAAPQASYVCKDVSGLRMCFHLRPPPPHLTLGWRRRPPPPSPGLWESHELPQPLSPETQSPLPQPRGPPPQLQPPGQPAWVSAASPTCQAAEGWGLASLTPGPP